MKNFLFILLFLTIHSFNAQKLPDYKYVYIPHNIKGFEDNKYQINSVLTQKLKNKGYEVIQNEQIDWPQELIQNPCKVAFINILNTSSLFKNKLTFEAKDCNGKVLMSQQGISNEKDFQIGYQQALEKSIAMLQNSSPKELTQLTLKKDASAEILKKADEPKAETTSSNENQKTEPDIVPDVTKPKADGSSSSNKSENYTNGTLVLQKIIIGDGKFILVTTKSSVPYATFRESSKKGIFHIILEDGTTTLGYLENENYVIDFPNKDGSFKKEIFEKN